MNSNSENFRISSKACPIIKWNISYQIPTNEIFMKYLPYLIYVTNEACIELGFEPMKVMEGQK